MSRPTAALALAVCLLLAGCGALGSPDSPPTSGASTTTGTETTASETETTTETTTLTEPTTTAGPCAGGSDLSTRTPPERPDALSRESAVSFVEDYERAVRWNDGVTAGRLSQSVLVTNVTVFGTTETGFLLRAAGDQSFKGCLDGRVVYGHGPFAANYFVNETVAIRLDDTENATDDPRDGGTVVEQWG